MRHSRSLLNFLIRAAKAGAHVNLIPLNPTNGYSGGPSQQEAQNSDLCHLVLDILDVLGFLNLQAEDSVQLQHFLTCIT